MKKLIFFALLLAGCASTSHLPVEYGYKSGDTKLSKFRMIKAPRNLGKGRQRIAVYKMQGDPNHTYMKKLQAASDKSPPTFMVLH